MPEGQDGTAIVVWGCNGASDQTWTLDPSSGTPDGYLLRNGKDPYMCLSVAAKSTSPWVALVLWHCKVTADNQDQRWYLTTERQAPYSYNSSLVAAADQYWGAPVMQMRQGYWFPFDAWVDAAPRSSRAPGDGQISGEVIGYARADDVVGMVGPTRLDHARPIVEAARRVGSSPTDRSHGLDACLQRSPWRSMLG